MQLNTNLVTLLHSASQATFTTNVNSLFLVGIIIIQNIFCVTVRRNIVYFCVIKCVYLKAQSFFLLFTMEFESGQISPTPSLNFIPKQVVGQPFGWKTN